MQTPPTDYPPDYPPPPPPLEPGYTHVQAAPAALHRNSSGQLWTIVAVIAGVALLVVVAGTYSASGYFTASSRINSANHAIDSAVAHRDAFDNAPIALGIDAPDSKTMQADATKFAKAWKDQVATIRSDEAALASADSGLHQQQWLTIIRRSDVDGASARIAHARKALDVAGTIAGDRVKEGQFELALSGTIADFEVVLTDIQAQDLAGAVTAAGKMQTDVNGALGLSGDTQFPPEVHDYVAAIQTLAKDLSDYLGAVGKGDTGGAKTLIDKTNNDATSIQAFDVTAMGEKVDTYYQALMDAYHTELSKAR